MDQYRPRELPLDPIERHVRGEVQREKENRAAEEAEDDDDDNDDDDEEL